MIQGQKSACPFTGAEVDALDGMSSEDDARAEETCESRVSRLYSAEGGPLMGWLLDEACRRRIDMRDMARELDVTYGYIGQLRVGLRATANISHEFAASCARFLGVPTVVVLLLAGYLRMSDFAFTAESEEEMVDRALRHVQEDPQVRAAVPVELGRLSLDAKKAVVMMYAESAGADVLNLRELPEILRWLQRAAVINDENAFEAMKGHRDTSSRNS